MPAVVSRASAASWSAARRWVLIAPVVPPELIDADNRDRNHLCGFCHGLIFIDATIWSAACFEITADILGGNCFNFEARTLKLNGTTESCAGSNWPMPLPAKKNGGYCVEISAGSNASAGIQTF